MDGWEVVLVDLSVAVGCAHVAEGDGGTLSRYQPSWTRWNGWIWGARYYMLVHEAPFGMLVCTTNAHIVQSY